MIGKLKWGGIKANLSHGELKALKNLASHKDLIIQIAHKGDMTVYFELALLYSTENMKEMFIDGTELQSFGVS